jgi:hypothetical protein
MHSADERTEFEYVWQTEIDDTPILQYSFIHSKCVLAHAHCFVIGVRSTVHNAVLLKLNSRISSSLWLFLIEQSRILKYSAKATNYLTHLRDKQEFRMQTLN